MAKKYSVNMEDGAVVSVEVDGVSYASPDEIPDPYDRDQVERLVDKMSGGDLDKEFAADLETISRAVQLYDLPRNLKLSVHSGSDKFSLYPRIRGLLRQYDAGIHLKTAGTTWLEELIGLAEAGGEGLALVKEVYMGAFQDREELCRPYTAVIDIDPAALPVPAAVVLWTPEQFAAAVRHDPSCGEFNPSLRQLLHVGYRVAAKMGRLYLDLIAANAEAIGRNVTANLLDRHIRPLLA